MSTPEHLAEDEARAALEQSHLTRAATGATGANIGLNASGQQYGAPGGEGATMQTQQTRHARRLYVGNIPDLSEVHNFFRDAIRKSIMLDPRSECQIEGTGYWMIIPTLQYNLRTDCADKYFRSLLFVSKRRKRTLIC